MTPEEHATRTIADLRAVRSLLAPEARWIQGDWCETRGSVGVECFCLGGAMAYVATDGMHAAIEYCLIDSWDFKHRLVGMGAAMEFLSDSESRLSACPDRPLHGRVCDGCNEEIEEMMNILGERVPIWNDYVHRTHAEVMARIDDAIARLKVPQS